MEKLYYGVAYYREYMPYERLAEDIRMMKEANINLVRIGESTWSTYEGTEGVFDFTPIDEVLDGMYAAGIDVIVGTPTYAIPSWLAKKHPEVMVTRKDGQQEYGARQIMDITNADYLFYAERLIKKMIAHVVDHPAVIGFQIDNETKHYGTSGKNVQQKFAEYLKAKYKTVENLNKEMGLAYWSNSISDWAELPSANGTINGSLGLEFARYQRSLVTQFLAWQSGLVREIKKEKQFITHNFDFEWRGYSFGIQPDVDHYAGAKVVDITGVDIYHPGQEFLTGAEISFSGDVARSTKQSNYLVLETQAQAFKQRVPFPNQLRLQAFSHIASGANLVEYWHWHSIHNSYETYWKGLLSHDFQPNPTYNEAITIGGDFKRLSKQLVNLKRRSQVAFVVSNDSLTAMDWFRFSETRNYNDLLRSYYDAFYKLNIPVDIVSIDEFQPQDYDFIVVTGMYATSDYNLQRIVDYIEAGGQALFTFKTGFSNENNQVRTTTQPGIIHEACGIKYSQFVEPNQVQLNSRQIEFQATDLVHDWMELVETTTATSLASYAHKHWGIYHSITENIFGKGKAYYIASYLEEETLTKVLKHIFKETKFLAQTENKIVFPLITKEAVNEAGNRINFYFNYSDDERVFNYRGNKGIELFSNEEIVDLEQIVLPAWGVKIVETTN